MKKIINFEEAKKRYEGILIEELKQEQDYAIEMLQNLISLTMVPLHDLGIDELTINSRGTIIKTKLLMSGIKGLDHN